MTRYLALHASLAALTAQLFASAALAQPTAILTSPSNGSWYDTRGGFDIEGLSSTPGSVELQYLDSNTEEWTHLDNFETSSEPSDDAQGDLRYPFSVYKTLAPLPTNYYSQGITREDGQRGNAFHLTVWGWGETPKREEGHYTTVYQYCGRSDQVCCYKQGPACDDDLACVKYCNSSGQCDNTIKVCKPQSGPDEPPAPPKVPQPPKVPEASECGAPGQDCCDQGAECSQKNSYCSSGKCMFPGDWWNVKCLCTNGFNNFYADIKACIAPDIETIDPLVFACGQAGALYKISCVLEGTNGTDPSLGQCLAHAGNIIAW